MSYDLEPIVAPRASGVLLRLLVGLVESPLSGWAIAPKLLRDAGVERLRRADAGTTPLPTAHPLRLARRADPERGAEPTEEELLGTPGRLPWPTLADYRLAYREGRADPREVAAAFLAALAGTEARRPPLRAFRRTDPDDVARQAEESARRWAEGRPRSPLEGAPVAVKDELDQAGYPTGLGTRFLDGSPAAAGDAVIVGRLRAAGALLVGKASMHEIGLGVTGLNPHHGPARNPWNPAHASGGSSSGSAVAVAAGLCPVALGADGGGSIRIPAAFCGVVGLKPTFGALPVEGAAPVCWSVEHVGPIAGSARDAAVAFRILAGGGAEEAGDSGTSFAGLLDTDLGRRGAPVRLGVYEPWFEDADPAIVASCRSLLAAFEARGAEIVPVRIPELALLRAVHLVTIVAEMAASQAPHLARHRRDYGLDTRLALALGRRLRADDYVQAQRHRERLCAGFAEVLDRVDAIATPATAVTAPQLPGGAALRTGLSDLGLTERVLRFCQAANVTGLPAISIPAGHDPAGLPVGLQLIGRAGGEAGLLRLAILAEETVDRGRPAVTCRLLPDHRAP